MQLYLTRCGQYSTDCPEENKTQVNREHSTVASCSFDPSICMVPDQMLQLLITSFVRVLFEGGNNSRAVFSNGIEKAS